MVRGAPKIKVSPTLYLMSPGIWGLGFGAHLMNPSIRGSGLRAWGIGWYETTRCRVSRLRHKGCAPSSAPGAKPVGISRKTPCIYKSYHSRPRDVIWL